MATYGWGTNEPIIAPEAEGGENIGTVCVKIKSAIADTFTKLNSETWSDASTTASGYMSSADKIKLNGIETGAEVNQFAFSNISVGGTTISADTKQDTLTLTAGTGITLTPDAGNDKVTIGFASGANVNIEGNAASATKLATARTFRTDLASTSTASFNGTANATPGVTGILPVANGGTGNSSGLAASATKLATGRTFRTNLASTATASFDGTANVTPGVTGILPVANGGTGNNKGAAPQPTTSAGVGQWCNAAVSGARVVVPSGGTWAVFCAPIPVGSNDFAFAGIYAGGSILLATSGGLPAENRVRYFLCWRIY